MAGGSLLLLLLLAAVISIVLGMGMPTLGVYLLLATLVAPSMIEGRRAQDGGASLRALFRDAVDDHAAGSDRGVRRGDGRALRAHADRGLGGGLRLVGLHRAVPVRAVARASDAGRPAGRPARLCHRGGRGVAGVGRAGRLFHAAAQHGVPLPVRRRRRGRCSCPRRRFPSRPGAIRSVWRSRPPPRAANGWSGGGHGPPRRRNDGFRRRGVAAARGVPGSHLRGPTARRGYDPASGSQSFGTGWARKTQFVCSPPKSITFIACWDHFP